MLLLTSLALASEPAARDALLARFDEHFSVEGSHEEGNGCLTGLVADLKQSWHLFSAEERARMTARLAPWKKDLLEPVVNAAPPAPPAMVPTDSCFGQQKANRLTSDHFVVEWDDEISETTAQRFLDALEQGWAVEVEELGWRAPQHDGTYLMPAYVAEGDYQSAYTTVESCGGEYAPYMVAYAGSFSQMSWANTMAVHEFNHALQFGYGFAWEFWWWEATATWIEDKVYPNVDWWAYYVTGYTDNPWIAMSAYSQQDYDVFYHMYGMAIWAFHLEDHYGGADVIRQTWEAAVDERGTYTFGQKQAMNEVGLDFDEVYLDFVARNAVMDYAQQSAFPRLDHRDTLDSLPAEGESASRSKVEGYGQDYWKFDTEAGAGDLRIAFTGDEDVTWALLLVENDDGAIVSQETVLVEGGVGEVVFEGFGVNDVTLAITPLVDTSSGHEYAFSATLETPPPAEGEGDADPDVDAEPVELAGCGCATPAGGAVPGLVIAGLAAIGAARRRRA